MRHKRNVSGKRRKPRFHRQTKAGAAPGTVRTAPGALAPAIHLISYNADRFVERPIADVDHLAEHLTKGWITWVDVAGLGDAKTVEKLGDLFRLHPLALEDVVNVHQRAKVEPYDDQIFIVARMASLTEHVESEQVAIFLGPDYVLTFQERPGDCFEPVRKRLRRTASRTRRRGADYLAYTLIDAVIDSYFPIVDGFADHLDELEEQVPLQRNPQILDHIHHLRNDLLLLRRSVRPHRESLNELVRDDHPLIGDETRIYLRDCYDHAVQLIDLLEVYREICADLRDYHLSMISTRMNEVMKVLTVIATIFMPLGFITGLYGMNFNTDLPGNMPELDWPYGYVAVLAFMGALVSGMLFYFRRRGWLGSLASSQADS